MYRCKSVKIRDRQEENRTKVKKGTETERGTRVGQKNVDFLCPAPISEDESISKRQQ
jgi:hypothetical protein